MQARAQDVPAYLDEIGTCTAREVVSIRPQASGQITAIHFTDGADLKKDQPLFTIDPRPYQAALDQAKATLAQTEAALGLAKVLASHAEVLYPIKATSKEDLDTKQSSVQTNKALIEANLAAIETAKVNLDYCFIHSPIDGRASKRLVDLGNVVTANSGTALLVIQRLDPIYADFTVPEQSLAAVRREMAKGTLKAHVRLPDDPQDEAREGDLTFLDNAVQLGTGTVALRATLANADHRFWPGQFVRVRLVLGTLKDAVLVPSQATQISQGGPFVYVVRPDHAAEIRLVKLGQRHGAMVTVTEGLTAGETVVVTGQLTIVPGEQVRVGVPRRPGGAGGPQTGTGTEPASSMPARSQSPSSASAPAERGAGGKL